MGAGSERPPVVGLSLYTFSFSQPPHVLPAGCRHTSAVSNSLSGAGRDSRKAETFVLFSPTTATVAGTKEATAAGESLGQLSGNS